MTVPIVYASNVMKKLGIMKLYNMYSELLHRYNVLKSKLYKELIVTYENKSFTNCLCHCK